MLKAGIYCLTAPIALIYGFHARRNAPERAVAWAGSALSLIVFIPFVMMMIGLVLNLRKALCR